MMGTHSTHQGNPAVLPCLETVARRIDCEIVPAAPEGTGGATKRVVESTLCPVVSATVRARFVGSGVTARGTDPFKGGCG
jgi:hypothetical protein